MSPTLEVLRARYRNGEDRPELLEPGRCGEAAARERDHLEPLQGRRTASGSTSRARSIPTSTATPTPGASWRPRSATSGQTRSSTTTPQHPVARGVAGGTALGRPACGTRELETELTTGRGRGSLGQPSGGWRPLAPAGGESTAAGSCSAGRPAAGRSSGSPRAARGSATGSTSSAFIVPRALLDEAAHAARSSPSVDRAARPPRGSRGS